MQVQIRPGDTFWYYSQLFFTPVMLIVDSNRDLDPASLKPGTAVSIPGFTEVSRTVKKGDTFWKIARDGNISVDALLLLNQDVNPNKLPVGESIRIPVRVTEPIVNGRRNYDSRLLAADLARLQSIYPFIVRRTAGESVLGKPMHEATIGRGSRNVQVNASFHANEWITTPVLMTFLNEYLLALTNGMTFRGVPATAMYTGSRLIAIPMVNPDGVDLVLNGPPAERRDELLRLNRGSEDFSGWKANIRGVDLNKQFPARWEFESERKPKEPGPRDFPGTAPLTEPETKVMADLVRTQNYDRLLALHTQGKEIYWGFEGLEPPESAMLAAEFARVSGYRAVQYVDSYAGYKDWFIQDFRKPGFTVELGLGHNPLPISQFDEIYRDVSPLLVRSLI